MCRWTLGGILIVKAKRVRFSDPPFKHGFVKDPPNIASSLRSAPWRAGKDGHARNQEPIMTRPVRATHTCLLGGGC